MAELTALLGEVGCKDISTYIQSGNVVFSTANKCNPTKVSEIVGKIEASHGFAPTVVILSVAELEGVIQANPYDTDDGQALHFFFLESKPEDADLDHLRDLKSGAERFELHDKVLYLHAPSGIGRSKLAANVEKCVGVKVTARNWNTVQKLRKLVGT
jgi:uncharacterized protein (DUF1697 family)|tara:strand:+ start:3192 stop:3662 length:471 start_codon:yes stop_codon:yes gene_type:complete